MKTLATQNNLKHTGNDVRITRETRAVWEYATVEPDLPGDAVSDIDLYLLKACGFSYQFDGNEGTYLFHTKAGISGSEECEMAVLKDMQAMDEFDGEVLAADDPADLPDAARTFARILRRAGMEELAIKGCYGGEVIKPGAFGGFVIRVTQSYCSYQDSNGILAAMADLGVAYPGTEIMSDQAMPIATETPDDGNPVAVQNGDGEIRGYDVLLYPVMWITMRDVKAPNWIEAIKAAAEQFTHYNGVWPYGLSFDDNFDRCLVDATCDPEQRVVTRWIYRDELATVLKS